MSSISLILCSEIRCLFIPSEYEYSHYLIRSGSPMSLSPSPVRIPSTGTSCWRIPRIPQPQGSCVTFLQGRDPRAQTGSASSSRSMGRTFLTTSVFVTGTATLHWSNRWVFRFYPFQIFENSLNFHSDWAAIWQARWHGHSQGKDLHQGVWQRQLPGWVWHRDQSGQQEGGVHHCRYAWIQVILVS